MSLSTLPLSYCTNVHPGASVAEVIRGLDQFTAPLQNAHGERIAAGLWLAASVIDELSGSPAQRDALSEALNRAGLVCYTLNAFPFGNFHSERVKEQVYLPDWAAQERLRYTWRCAEQLALLMPEGVEGSLSTAPLGFKELPHVDRFRERCIDQLLELARRLDQLHDETGRVLRLAIEPEPFCELETTAEALDFFNQIFRAAEQQDCEEVARRHLGLCYDVCHQAVEFEDVAHSIGEIARADVRINKVHITCALRLEHPGENVEGRRALAEYVEPRYLHQTLARAADGRIARCPDLTTTLCAGPPADFLAADEWRIHFHVPVHAERIGPLRTTRDDLRRAIPAVARLAYAPHLEVETYTWGVLPGEPERSLVQGLASELSATRKLLADSSAGA